MSCTKENCNQTVYTSGGILPACVLKKKKRVTVVAKSRGGHGDVRPEAQARLKDAPFPSCKSVFGHICAGHGTSQWMIHDMRHLIYIRGHVYITGNVPIELHTS